MITPDNLDIMGQRLLAHAAKELGLNGPQIAEVLQMAQAAATLNGESPEAPSVASLAEAIQYRSKANALVIAADSDAWAKERCDRMAHGDPETLAILREELLPNGRSYLAQRIDSILEASKLFCFSS